MITLAFRAAESALTWAGVLGRTFAELEVLVSSLSTDMDLPTGLLGFLAKKSRSLQKNPHIQNWKNEKKRNWKDKAFEDLLHRSKPLWGWFRVGVVALDPDLFSYIEVDITPVVAMLNGRGLRLVWGRIRTCADEVGVSVPLIALGERPLRSKKRGEKPRLIKLMRHTGSMLILE